MNKILLISIGLFISLVSCKQRETENEIIVKKSKTTESNIDSVKEEKYNIEYIYNDTISAKLKSSLELLASDTSKFKIAIRPTKNREDSSLIDTLKTLTYDKTEFVIYKTKNWGEVISAEIKNSEFVLINTIKIGMNIADFRNVIKIKPETGIILIMDTERRIGFRFIFDNGILNFIDYEGGYN